MTSQEELIQATESYVQNLLAGEASGHDWWHIVRVVRMAKKIASREGGDTFICVMAALLHDVADEKFNSHQEAGLKKVAIFLEQLGLDKAMIEQILDIIATMSFKGGGGSPMSSLEGQIVQDADRLDALGAIGIARTMAYSGYKGRLIHHPDMTPREKLTAELYRKGEDTAIMHFHEKLLRLKDLMNTAYARELAQKRHDFMLLYLERFLREWEGEF